MLKIIQEHEVEELRKFIQAVEDIQDPLVPELKKKFNLVLKLREQFDLASGQEKENHRQSLVLAERELADYMEDKILPEIKLLRKIERLFVHDVRQEAKETLKITINQDQRKNDVREIASSDFFQAIREKKLKQRSN